MVIHDMRNPSYAAEFGIKESLSMVRESIDDLKQLNSNLKASI